MNASIARKWIELNWLRKGNKEISLPELIFEKTEIGSANYFKPQKGEWIIGERFFDFSRGLIVISPNPDDKFMLNSLAHEWRHHWQTTLGIETSGPKWNPQNIYKNEIIRFFNDYQIEMDALLYAIKKAPDDINLQWLDWIKESKK